MMQPSNLDDFAKHFTGHVELLPVPSVQLRLRIEKVRRAIPIEKPPDPSGVLRHCIQVTSQGPLHASTRKHQLSSVEMRIHCRFELQLDHLILSTVMNTSTAQGHPLASVHPTIVGDRVVVVTQTALSAVAQADQPAGRRGETGAWRAGQGLVLPPPGRRAVGDTAGWAPCTTRQTPSGCTELARASVLAGRENS